ncbi:MAG: class I SAM-dependent methyltransferase [Candidatus Levyibacteriota bacterium]
MKNTYNNYFKDHYKSTHSEKDILNYQKWFYAQWQFINSKINIKAQSNILEIGSAMGGFYSYLESKNPNYLGVELDKSMVDFTTKYFQKQIFMKKSIESLKIEKRYDYVFAFEVLEHLENPLTTVGKIHKLLNKDSIFCGSTPYPFYKNIVNDQTHLYVLHPKSWERIFLLNGFKEVNLYPMSFPPYLWRINKRLNITMPFFVPFTHFVSTCLIIAKK